MIRRQALIIGLIGLFTVGALSAANSKVGTSGAQFLKIGAGARPTSMGDAFTAIADDVNAVHFNPAGLGQLKQSEVTAMHTQWFEGLDYNFGALALPTSMGTFGVSAYTLEAEDLVRRDVAENNLGSFSNLDTAYGLSYGRQLGESLFAGGTAKYVRQEIDSRSASAWAGDVGALKKFGPKYSVGLAARNFGQKIEFVNDGDPLPFVVDLGVAGRFVENRLLIGLTASSPRDNDLQYGGGIEWAERNHDVFRYAVRAGYKSLATDADGADGLTIGAGIGFRKLDLDFAWVPMGDLGNTFRYAVLFRF